jgi:uncharacterized surface protein with fasciclin (FAS1) repeats
MKFKAEIIMAVVALFFLAACNKDWEAHYKSEPVTSNENVWDAIQKEPGVSSFVNYLKQHQYDTLFITNNTYTLFAPTNEAFDVFLQADSVTSGVLAYHVSTFFIQTASIDGKRKVQTFSEKFALFNNTGSAQYIDDIEIEFESPLYRNGKYFILGQVAKPKPNLYEYIALSNPVLKKYIDSEDSVFLNKELSKPLGFDENGNTIYDTVAEIINMFEIEYFPVSEEYRNKTATLVFPKEENYNAALTNMAMAMDAGYSDYRDIPEEWQNEVLIPYLLERGVFENMLEREEFLKKSIKDTVKLKNILGDSVVIDYEPGEKTICSNGYAYNYFNFEVPDTLYQAPTRFEPESLVKTLGPGKFAWYEDVKVVSTIGYAPKKEYVSTASNDTVLVVEFNKGYTGIYNLEFNIDNLFPRRFLAVFRIRMNKGGIFDIYMNNQLIRHFDYNVDILYNSTINSVISGKRYLPQAGGYNRFDCWVENLQEYGTAKMRIEYKGPGTVSTNGILLDYIEFIPAENL